MSKSTHQFEIRGIDKSGPAFDSVKAKAALTGKQIKSMVGGALAAAGAYLSLRAIKGGIDELGTLSDLAMKSSTSVDELTKATAAFGAIGIQNMGVEQFAKALAMMEKNTGRTGMEGLYQTVREIGKVPDASKRAELAMEAFGKSGLEFVPLINAADESIDALQDVVAAMPGVPQAAADAGDAISDAVGFGAKEFKSIWLQGLGLVCSWFDNEYAGGVREASLRACNSMEYYTRVACAKCIAMYQKLRQYLKRYGEAVGAYFGSLSAGSTFAEASAAAADAYDQAVQEYEETAKEIEALEKARTDRFKRDFEDRAIAINKFQGVYDKAAEATAKREQREQARQKAVASKRISNDLALAGTNAAIKMQILGPSYQSEEKKQTSLLEKIAANTAKTADSIDKEIEKDYFGTVN